MIHYSILLVFFLCVTSSYAANKVVPVNVICGRAKNPSFCSNLLNPKSGADLVTLSQYTIDVTRADMTNTVKLINTLIKQSASNVKASNHYNLCLKLFVNDGGALFVLDNVQRVLKEGNYHLMNVGANDIAADINRCINDPNFRDTSSLPRSAGKALQDDQVIQTLSTFLMSN
ncbi:pectinesterase inhibitor 2-like [Vicia villosa]|uniref:pectinesterase inhibitor 2-like n=1 Tax=Vicia villosa TaxID=3911 RepID=UPI00273ADB38|nr:pectinesterase inhibitor 2-like [Vicia villosa]